MDEQQVLDNGKRQSPTLQQDVRNITPLYRISYQCHNVAHQLTATSSAARVTP